jgi:hypothetical protein
MGLTYFVYINNEKKGSLTFEELIAFNITKNTLVWRSDKEDWVKAENLEELQGHLRLLPPPLPGEIEMEKKRLKDERIKKGAVSNIKSGVIVSIVLGVIINIIYFSSASNGGSDLNPIYLSSAERDNPSLIFWNQLPFSILVGFILGFVYYLVRVYSFSSEPTEIETIKIEPTKIETQINNNEMPDNKEIVKQQDLGSEELTTKDSMIIIISGLGSIRAF